MRVYWNVSVGLKCMRKSKIDWCLGKLLTLRDACWLELIYCLHSSTPNEEEDVVNVSFPLKGFNLTDNC